MTVAGAFLLILLLLPAVAASSANAPALPASQQGDCAGRCWRYDEGARTLTWAGPADGREDVWQGDDLSLGRVRAGWTAVFGPMAAPGEIEACVLNVDGEPVRQSCGGAPYPVPSGRVLHVTSADPDVGGFRWRPAGGYGYRSLYDLQVTPPPDASFEIPFWIVPGGMRQLSVSTHRTYLCYTPLNPLSAVIVLPAAQCKLVLGDFAHEGWPSAIEWGRNYNGSFTRHVIRAYGSDRLVSLNAGENKNENLGGECGQGGRCWQNTINANVACAAHSSGWCKGVYEDYWGAYNGLINLSWQVYDAAHAWGMQAHTDEGPIVWPANGYTYGGEKTSNGVRHPHGLAAGGYLWVFYEDNSNGAGALGYGIRAARAPESSGGLPGSWQTYCHGGWAPALPAGFRRENMAAFYPQRGGCATQVLPVGGKQMSFAAARNSRGGYLGIEEHLADDGLWELRLWQSPDLVNWRFVRSYLATSGGWDAGELHYPVLLSEDGWSNELVDGQDFYIVGTGQGKLRAYHIRSERTFLPLLIRG